jgi:hypothetical protein
LLDRESFENLVLIEQAFEVMAKEGIQLVGIGPKDIHSGNRKLVLGLIWLLILRYHMPKVIAIDMTLTRGRPCKCE